PLCLQSLVLSFMFPFFFFNDTATTELYTLSLHDALPISGRQASGVWLVLRTHRAHRREAGNAGGAGRDLRTCAGGHSRLHAGERSEEHTSELQSRGHLVCRLLLEKKKK